MLHIVSRTYNINSLRFLYSNTLQGVSLTSMFNNANCSQAYAQAIDQCLSVQGLNLDDLIAAFSSNNATVYMPLLNRLVNLLCGGSACRVSILNAYRACMPGMSVSVHCTCVCMDVCVFICVYICAFLCVHMCVCLFVCLCVCSCVFACICVCVCVFVCVYACVCVYLCVYMRVCVFACVYACVCVCLCVYACVSVGPV